MIDFAAARNAMVENQLRPSRISNTSLLAAMSDVPRELFLPARLRGIAYHDEDIDLGDGRQLIEPLVLAKLIQALDPDPRAAALVIGCHTGYCTAILARLAGTVFHLCATDEQHKQVAKNLEAIDCDNAIVKTGAAIQGLEDQAPFGSILFAGSLIAFPKSITAQLDNYGRAVAVISQGRAGHLTIAERVGTAIGLRAVDDAAIMPLTELKPAELFEF